MDAFLRGYKKGKERTATRDFGVERGKQSEQKSTSGWVSTSGGAITSGGPGKRKKKGVYRY